MKLYRFFLSILAGAALAAGCVQEQVISSLDSFQVENSYLSIALEGGIANTAVKATAQWSFDDATVPEWLTVTPRSGGSEVTGIVFAADANTGSSARTANLVVNVGSRKQRFTVIQAGPGAYEAPISTIAEVMAGNDGQTFRVRGTVTTISNTNYGNLYVQDETGTIYIYGLFNAKGQYPKDAGGWNTFGVESGDIITVQGPRTLYNGTTLELVDATLIKVEKSLISVEPGEIALESAEAGTFTISVVSKADGMAVLPSESWIKLRRGRLQLRLRGQHHHGRPHGVRRVQGHELFQERVREPAGRSADRPEHHRDRGPAGQLRRGDPRVHRRGEDRQGLRGFRRRHRHLCL